MKNCNFLELEAQVEINDDDEYSEDEEEQFALSSDSFINDSQTQFTCDEGLDGTVHRMLDNEKHNDSLFETPPLLKRRRCLDRGDDATSPSLSSSELYEDQSLLPSSSPQSSNSIPSHEEEDVDRRKYKGMNFIRSVMDHMKKGGKADDIENEFKRLEALHGDVEEEPSSSQESYSQSQYSYTNTQSQYTSPNSYASVIEINDSCCNT